MFVELRIRGLKLHILCLTQGAFQSSFTEPYLSLAELRITGYRVGERGELERTCARDSRDDLLTTEGCRVTQYNIPLSSVKKRFPIEETRLAPDNVNLRKSFTTPAQRVGHTAAAAANHELHLFSDIFIQAHLLLTTFVSIPPCSIRRPHTTCS
jgi:hypothetical protein